MSQIIIRLCDEPIIDEARTWLSNYCGKDVQIVEVPRFKFGTEPGKRVRQLLLSKRFKVFGSVVIECSGNAKIVGSIFEATRMSGRDNMPYVRIFRQLRNPDFQGYEQVGAYPIDWRLEAFALKPRVPEM
ncbi:hypothetical protein KBC70_02900 [Candidatus Woesebacteria bacterium]|nr:hypothetical protein [Candidatus Woesebacteria bacterium]